MSAKFQDYYETLGISRDATEKDIKAAYRKMARKWHPDLHPASEKIKVENKFKRINEAYEVLKDPDKRSSYDQLGSRWRDGQDFQASPDMKGGRYYTSGDFGSDHGGGFSDFFDMMFGGAAAGRGSTRGTRKVKGEDLESEIQLSIEEAYRGTVKSLRVSGSKVCAECGGSAMVGGGFCPRCGGTGTVAEEKTLEVKVPAGVQEGSRIRLKGQGGTGLGSGAPRGDLFLKIRIMPHPVFRLKENHIESDVILRPEQAVLGDRVPVQTLDGEVSVTVPAGSNSNKKLRLRGKGFPDKQKGRGDHYVRIVINVPQNPSEEEKELYRQLRNVSISKSGE